MCVCVIVWQEGEGVARKYQEEQLDFYERNWISSRHIIIVEHFHGSRPSEDKKPAQWGRGTQAGSQRGHTQSVYPAHRKSPLMI